MTKRSVPRRAKLFGVPKNSVLRGRASALARSDVRRSEIFSDSVSKLRSNFGHELAERGRILLIIAIMSVVVISGCVNQTPTVVPEIDGLVIKNVFIDPPADQIQSGDRVSITADIENLGSATARNVVAELIGASWITSGIASQYSLGGIVLANYVDIDEEGDGIRGTTLTPPDPQYGTPGQMKTLRFVIPAPLLPEGQQAKYELKIRVKYDYETSAVAQIKGYSRERYNSLYQQGKLTPPSTVEIPVQVSKNVPVTIGILGPDKFIAGPSIYDEYTYQLTFKNVGTNLPITRDPMTGRETDGLISGAVWIQGPGIFFRNCMGITPEILYSSMPTGLNDFITTMQVQYKDRFSAWYQDTPWGDAWNVAGKIGNLFVSVGQTPTPPSLSIPAYVLFPNALSWDIFGFMMEPVKLRQGGTVTKSCTIGIWNDPTRPETWFNRAEDSMLVNAHLQYRYYVDNAITLTVTAPIVRVPYGG